MAKSAVMGSVYDKPGAYCSIFSDLRRDIVCVLILKIRNVLSINGDGSRPALLSMSQFK